MVKFSVYIVYPSVLSLNKLKTQNTQNKSSEKHLKIIQENFILWLPVTFNLGFWLPNNPGLIKQVNQSRILDSKD